MAINLNTEPYYDDFDEDKNFYQILFKPSLAVQARELTQLQTILRDQVKKFGNHIFQHGSVVIPGNSLSDLAVPYVTVDSLYNSQAVNISNFEGSTIVGATSGVEAIVKKAIGATETDPIVFYLSYTSGNSAGEVVFQDAEELYIKDATTVRATASSTNSTGVGSLAYINHGVYYINGTFVTVVAQSTVLSKFSSEPSCHVLLKIKEQIVDSNDDETLLDNAQSSYNYAAPGADRLKISLELVTLPLNSAITNDYVEIMRYNAGVLEEHATNPKYSELEKSLARRTFDESGNYIVNGLKPKIREHLKSNNNGGLYADGDISKLVVEVDPGKAYINGFEIEKISKTKIDINKARTPEHIKSMSAILRPEYGQYLIVSDITGTLSINNHQTVSLYNDNDASNASAIEIGSAKVIGIDYLIGDPTSLDGAVYKLWVTDVALNPGYTIESAGGIRYDSTKYAYVLTQYNAPVTSGSFTVGEVINHSSGRRATVKYWDASTATLYAYKHDHTKQTPRAGDFITGSISSTISTITNKAMIVSVGQSGLVFRLPKNVPYSLKNPDSNSYDLEYTIQKELSIVSNSSGDGSVSVSSGETINPIEVGTFVAVGPSGVVSNNKFSLNIDGTTLTLTGGPVSSTVKIYAAVAKSGVAPKTKTVTSYTQVVTTPGSSTITLDKTDIIKITSIVDTVGDITANYTLWNGQNEYEYDRGTLTLKAGKSSPVGNVTIVYSYYEHSIAGDFFCIDSYPAGILETTNVYNSSSTGQLYNLASCLDFRPSVGTDGALTGTGSRRNSLPIAGTTFNSSLQFYVPRIDVLTINANGSIKVISGIPSENPKIPTVANGQFAVNVFYIPEYTQSASLVASKRLDVERFTMGAIKQLSNKIDRVENFASLTAAEMSVTTVNVKDAATGLDKFKTGYLVENFTSPLSIARTTSGDWAATFVGQTLQPKMEDLLCQLYLMPASSNNFVNKNNYLMLPYGEAVFAQQKLSSRVTNLNPFIVISWNGVLGVNPSSDDWVEIRDLPTVFEEKTEEVIVTEYLPCPPPPPPPPTYWDPGPSQPVTPRAPLPATTYGGWYGEVLGRLGEGSYTTGSIGGVDYWSNSILSGNSVQSVAATFLETAYHNYAIGTEWGREAHFNPVSLDQLATNTVMASQTDYWYDSNNQVVAHTSGVNIDGTTFSYTTPV